MKLKPLSRQRPPKKQRSLGRLAQLNKPAARAMRERIRAEQIARGQYFPD
jgi:hypothetical protein